ncbi:hypothetical protein V8J82_18705 [Gymnodinialimonas sp. 2305UL16-5]|uniref:hypothetical protein n=1 Tax=Gymnodinialimonas mytili TaxID=3126503 RepID=UPI0030A8CC76
MAWIGLATGGQAQNNSDDEFGLNDLLHQIAFEGASCVMLAGSVDTRIGPTSIDSLAVETGVAHALITEWARERAREHDIASDVLQRAGTPHADPPEPFLMILQHAQINCQNLDRYRNILQLELDQNVLPRSDTCALERLERADALERLTRLRFLIAEADDAIALGDYGAELVQLANAIARRNDITLDDLTGISSSREATERAVRLMPEALRPSD